MELFRVRRFTPREVFLGIGGPIGSSFSGPGSPPLTTCDSRPGGTASLQIRGSLRPDQLRRLRRLDLFGGNREAAARSNSDGELALIEHYASLAALLLIGVANGGHYN